MESDIQGAEKVHKVNPNWNFLFVEPPSMQELEKRLRDRGTETEEAIKKRTFNAKIEMERASEVKFYRHLVNDELTQCYKNFIGVINQCYHLLIGVAE